MLTTEPQCSRRRPSRGDQTGERRLGRQTLAATTLRSSRDLPTLLTAVCQYRPIISPQHIGPAPQTHPLRGTFSLALSSWSLALAGLAVQ